MIATRSGKENQPLNIKTAVERPILKLRLPNFRWSFYFILLPVMSLLFRRIYMTSQMKLFSASKTYRCSIFTNFYHEVELFIAIVSKYPCCRHLNDRIGVIKKYEINAKSCAVYEKVGYVFA